MIDFAAIGPLEQEAITLVRQYRFLLPRPVKDFLRRVAAALDWNMLLGELK